MAGFSIPAAEHSTITSWGKENEEKAFDNMLDKFSGKDNLVAVVSDSYDLYNAIEHIWGNSLKQKVINNGGTIIIRPIAETLSVVPNVIQKLMHIFGSHKNSKGYKALPDFIRVIQGDGVNIKTIEKCLAILKKMKISTENITFGMGGALLQKQDRDTLKFAVANARCDENNNKCI